MIFRRNLFYPIRLLLYPMLAIILIVNAGVQISFLLDVVIAAVGVLFLVEAIWESATPYLVLNDNEIRTVHFCCDADHGYGRTIGA